MGRHSPKTDMETAFLLRLVHDLRGPVRAIDDIPVWLREDLDAAAIALPDQSVRLLPLLSENAARLDAILSGLAAWIAAQSPPTDPAPVADPVTEISTLADRFNCEVDIQTGPLPIAAADFAVIARHALENSVRFHPKGQPRVMIEGGMTADHWHLEFLDDGLGPPVAIPRDLIAPLARSPVGEQAAGSGFGLAIIARIAARYGADLHFDKAPHGQGTQLCLRGPAITVNTSFTGSA